MLQPGDRAPAFSARPVFGLPVHTGGRPLVVLFLRSLAGGLSRAAIAAGERALPRVEAAGAAMVGFTCCDLTLARDAVPRDHVLFPVVVDDGTRFSEWGVARDPGLRRSVLALLRPANLRLVASSLPLRRSTSLGGIDQLGATFVVDADGVLRYADYARTLFDLPDPEAICAALP